MNRQESGDVSVLMCDNMYVRVIYLIKSCLPKTKLPRWFLSFSPENKFSVFTLLPWQVVKLFVEKQPITYFVMSDVSLSFELEILNNKPPADLTGPRVDRLHNDVTQDKTTQ